MTMTMTMTMMMMMMMMMMMIIIIIIIIIIIDFLAPFEHSGTRWAMINPPKQQPKNICKNPT